jgi:hypothetical protein
MIWRTLLVDAWVDAARLREAAADAIGVPEADVTVVDDEAGLLAVPETVTVMLERTRQYRDFPSQVLAVLRDPDLERRYTDDDAARRVVAELAGRLGQTILVDHGPIEPWELLRVRPDGVEDIVTVEWEETGDVDSAVVVRERSLPEPREESVARVSA